MSYIPALCKTGCPARSKRIISFWAVKLTGISAFERIDMTEYEQCMLMALKDIKSQLGGINDGLYSITKELKVLNEREDNMVDPGMVSYEIEKLNNTFTLIKEIILERS